ncbi:thioredoxin family protein [Nocardiopsis coralliicola]
MTRFDGTAAPGTAAEAGDTGLARSVAGGGAVLAMFSVAHCPPCRQMEPVLDAAAAEDPALTVLRVEGAPEAVRGYGVLATPTLLVFTGGGQVRSMVGARRRRRLRAELADALG